MMTRVAGPEDAGAVVALWLEFLDELGIAHQRDHVEWAVQASTRDPLRGIAVVAVTGEDTAAKPVGLAVLETRVSAVHGWMAWLACLHVRREHRGRGIGRWLLAETLESARYHGLNHIACQAEPDRPSVTELLISQGFEESASRLYRIDTKPHFDDGTS